MTTFVDSPGWSLAAAALPAGTTARLLPAVPSRSWAAHLTRLGPLPLHPPRSLGSLLDAVALRGRSGGGFPAARRFAAVAAASGRNRRPVVLVNACEGDPTSGKDVVLLQTGPHLVIDGALLAVEDLGADRVILAVRRTSPAAALLRTALAERPPAPVPVSVAEVPDRYVASEATSLINYLQSGDARPLGRAAKIWESGVDGRPTLVSNAETYAQLALLGRFGADWFRSVGLPDEPGTALVTVSGAARRPGVLEISTGTPVRALLDAVGAAPTGWALCGGLAGRWVRVEALGEFGTAPLAAAGAVRGPGSLVLLPPDGCVLAETTRILEFLAAAGARQCGPCMFGLPAIAADFAALTGGDGSAIDRLRRRLPIISGRGACAHPDGAVAVAVSALNVLLTSLNGHLDQHLRYGPCPAPVVVPLGGTR